MSKDIARNSMRTHALISSVALLLFQTACANAPPSNTIAQNAEQARAADELAIAPKDPEAQLAILEARPLPAGLYFRDGHYEHRACPNCKEPTWAVITGVYGAIDDANQAISAAYEHRPSLPAGYPWATHTQDLAIEDASQQGVVIVTGLFTKEADAKQWALTHDKGWKVTRLATREVALERLYDRQGDSAHVEEDEHVFQLEYDDRRQPVAAYAPADLTKLFKTLDGQSWSSFEEYKATRQELTEALEPTCQVPAGKLFLTRGYDDFNRFQRAFLPVSCDDGALAYVPLYSTRHQAVMAPAENGQHRLVQVIIVECDVAYFQEWRYSSEAGRRAPRENETLLALESSGCGEP